MRIPSVAHKEQIDVLEAKLREQDVLLDSLKQRADTISKRYKEFSYISALSPAGSFFPQGFDAPVTVHYYLLTHIHLPSLSY
jgi:hypothetical protein